MIQDPNNGKIIVCNQALRDVFNERQLDFSNIAKAVSRHLSSAAQGVGVCLAVCARVCGARRGGTPCARHVGHQGVRQHCSIQTNHASIRLGDMADV